MMDATFRKSPLCESSACLEVAKAPGLPIADALGHKVHFSRDPETGDVLLRERPDGRYQRFTVQEWEAFLRGVKETDFADA